MRRRSLSSHDQFKSTRAAPHARRLFRASAQGREYLNFTLSMGRSAARFCADLLARCCDERPMQFHATAWTDGKSARAPITEERFRILVAARNDVLFAVELEEKLSLLIDNFAELEMDLLALAQKATIKPRHDHDASMTDRLQLDRRLVNLLTAGRLYLDQTAHGISGMFGKKSAEFDAFKMFKNVLHTKHWGYRLLEALRNHVQHAGLLIQKISYDYSGVGGAGSGQVETSVVPISFVRKFEEDPEFNKKVLLELKRMGTEVDLRSPTREYVTCLVKVHDELRRATAVRVTPAREAYAAAITEFGIIGDARTSSVHVESCDEVSGVVSDPVYLGTDILGRLDALIERNRLNPEFARFSATNRDKKSGHPASVAPATSLDSGSS